MRAWQVAEHGDPAAVMTLTEVPTPVPAHDEVVVEVLAAAANFPDVLMCRGSYQVKPRLPFTPGVEVCGRIVAVGESVGDDIRHGDRVLGAAVVARGGTSGGFAQYALMPAAETFPAPESLDDAEATSLYIGYQSAWFGLHRRANLQPGQTLLVHAAAGGVGSAAVQVGKAAGATVIGVVSSPEKGDVARSLGADIIINRNDTDFVEAVNDQTDGRGADVIFDPVGGETYLRSTKCIAFEGSIVVVGFAGGDIQTAALNHALIKNYSIVGLHWGLYLRHDRASVAECHQVLTDLVDEGRIRPLVSERHPLSAMAAGIQRLADGRTVGRIVYDASLDTQL